jgi:hypothetical protein
MTHETKKEMSKIIKIKISVRRWIMMKVPCET